MANRELTDVKQKLTSLVAGSDETKKTLGKKPVAKKNTGKNRRKSRELVLKAVYRGMLNASDLASVFRDMAEDPDYNKADEAYFKFLLESVTNHVHALDEKMASFIDRKITELSPVEHAILRISGCELMFDMSIPYRVVINEGVELAKIYGGTDGHKYINGVLDKLALDVRTAEVKNIKK
ncbi:MAG: transcription antitermination factor NusB [Methylotenera sp.]|nr:transcription antitermination factor NusB [Methylotenera sp.]MSP99398.1 transcription antitermination factor NusB [Methylotenera sp.]